MTYQPIGNDALCDKLRFKFKDRGINKVLAPAPSSLSSDNKRTTASRTQAPGREPASRATSVSTVVKPTALDGRYGAAYARGAQIRDYAERFNEESYERRHKISREQKPKKPKVSLKSRVGAGIKRFFSREETDAIEEKRVKSAPIPKGLVASLILCTVLLMVVLNTFSSYSEMTSEVKKLQSEQTTLLEEKNKVANLLSIRDDIREIELYATEEIGMVKSDYVETRHVSIAGGERMEIIETDETEDPTGLFSTLLSAVGSYREKLLEYID